MSDRRSALPSLPEPAGASSLSPLSMPKRLLSACISATNFGSLTVRRKISSASNMMPAITAKYAV